MRQRFSRWPVTSTVIVNTKTGKAFRGVLYAKRGPLLVLKQTQLHEHGNIVDVDGDVLIERENVDFVQVVG